MGAVKQALIEIDDFVSGCIRQGRTLNQTVRDALEESKKNSNPYFTDGDLIEDKYYQFKGNY